MPKARTTRSTKAPQPAPYDAAQAKKAAAAQKATKDEKKKLVAKKTHPLFMARPKKSGIGHIRRATDLTRAVKWPIYVRVQRQKRVLQTRLKVPPVLNSFNNTVSKNTAARLFSMADKYKPETKQEKRARLLDFAKRKAEDASFVIPPPPAVLKYGIRHITSLVEQKEATLVLIAHDVDPIEIVVWLPALCRRMGVPYAIVKGKARLGQLVHKKTATAVAFKKVNPADSTEFAALVQVVNEQYLGEEADKLRRRWGGGKISKKAQTKAEKKAKAAI